MAMTFAGTFGVPRRHYDISFAAAPFAVEFNPAVDLILGVMALGGLLASLGGAIYILSTVWSVFFGKPLAEDATFGAVPAAILKPPPAPPAGDADHKGLTRGTLVLVGVFLLAFIAYYFVNWKLLSAVWRVG